MNGTKVVDFTTEKSFATEKKKKHKNAYTMPLRTRNTRLKSSFRKISKPLEKAIFLVGAVIIMLNKESYQEAIRASMECQKYSILVKAIIYKYREWTAVILKAQSIVVLSKQVIVGM